MKFLILFLGLPLQPSPQGQDRGHKKGSRGVFVSTMGVAGWSCRRIVPVKPVGSCAVNLEAPL